MYHFVNNSNLKPYLIYQINTLMKIHDRIFQKGGGLFLVPWYMNHHLFSCVFNSETSEHSDGHHAMCYPPHPTPSKNCYKLGFPSTKISNSLPASNFISSKEQRNQERKKMASQQDSSAQAPGQAQVMNSILYFKLDLNLKKKKVPLSISFTYRKKICQ